jgi:type IV secretory pathway TrbL component
VRVIMVRMLTTVPAYVAVGLWFVFQLISAFGVIGQGPQSGGGVAFMAHIGGFIAGAALVKLVRYRARRAGTRLTCVSSSFADHGRDRDGGDQCAAAAGLRLRSRPVTAVPYATHTVLMFTNSRMPKSDSSRP